MPVLFRPRRLKFKQSMRESQEITSLSDVQQIIGCVIPLWCIHHGYNEANGWDEYAVTFYGGEYIGFTNSFLEPVD